MAKNKRKGLTKKIRFEVFKRDSFTCQYCGRSAPEVILEVDHIVSIKNGGSNDILNLVTACYDCNRGKGALQLSDKTAVSIAKKQADEQQERLAQIEMMARWQRDLRIQRDAEKDIVEKAFFGPINDNWTEIHDNGNWHLTENGHKTVYKWLRQFGLANILESICIAHESYLELDEWEAFTEQSIQTAFNKVGGICFNRKKRDEA